MTIITTDSRFQKLWMSSSEELYYKRQDAGGGNWEIGVHIIMEIITWPWQLVRARLSRLERRSSLPECLFLRRATY